MIQIINFLLGHSNLNEKIAHISKSTFEFADAELSYINGLKELISPCLLYITIGAFILSQLTVGIFVVLFLLGVQLAEQIKPNLTNLQILGCALGFFILLTSLVTYLTLYHLNKVKGLISIYLQHWYNPYEKSSIN